MSKSHLKLSPMVRENFEIRFAQMSKNYPNSSTMADEILDIYVSQMSKSHLKLSTMVGENFEINFA